MNNSKKYGFTLGEVLLATLIVGIIAVLTIPSVMKGVQQKARMSLLKGMTGNLSNLVEAELTKSRTTDITDTDIYKNPQTFLKRLDYNPSGKPFASSYKRYSDLKPASVLIPSDDNEGQAAVALKNGVGVGIINYPEEHNSAIIVDVTGDKEPNIIGADYFVFKIVWDDNITENSVSPGNSYNSGSYRAGDIVSYENGGLAGTETKAGLKTACKDGNGAACFRLVELSNYEPDYLD